MDAPSRSATPLFDATYYRGQLDRRPGTAVEDGDLLAHYRGPGWRLGLDPHPLFSTRHYLAQAGGLDAAGSDPLTHFQREGAAAGLSCHPCFDLAHYRSQIGGHGPVENPLLHYLTEGRHSGCRRARSSTPPTIAA